VSAGACEVPLLRTRVAASLLRLFFSDGELLFFPRPVFPRIPLACHTPALRQKMAATGFLVFFSPSQFRPDYTDWSKFLSLVACRLFLFLVLILLRLYVSSEYVRVRGSMKWRKCSRDFSSSPAMMLPLTRVHNRGQWRDSSSRRKQLLCTRCYLDEAGGMSSSLEAKKNQAGEKKSSSSSTTASGTYRRHFPFFPAMLACASIL